MWAIVAGALLPLDLPFHHGDALRHLWPLSDITLVVTWALMAAGRPPWPY